MTEETNVIVGAGQAGAHAAMAMREAGFGGRILLIGEEADPPYERPPLSKEALTADPEPAPARFFAPETYAARGITLRTACRVDGIDVARQRLRLGDGTEVAYDRLLLATGGRARTLDVPGGATALTLRTAADARRLRARLIPGARVVIAGAGVIGLEIAAAARRRGSAVTVVEALPGVMGRCVTPAMAAWIRQRHETAGVAFHFGAPLEAIEPGRVIAAGMAIPADVVLAGIGMVRNTALAAAAGAAVDGGIVVDERGATTIAGIWAAGDVAAFRDVRSGRTLRLESWRHAMNHGIAVGRAMAGDSAPYDDVPWFWTDQHGHTIQVAGLTGDARRTIWRGEPFAPSSAAFHLDDAGCVVAAEGIDAPREVRAAMAMIRAGRAPDPERLADPASNLQALARGR